MAARLNRGPADRYERLPAAHGRFPGGFLDPENRTYSTDGVTDSEILAGSCFFLWFQPKWKVKKVTGNLNLMSLFY